MSNDQRAPHNASHGAGRASESIALGAMSTPVRRLRTWMCQRRHQWRARTQKGPRRWQKQAPGCPPRCSGSRSSTLLRSRSSGASAATRRSSWPTPRGEVGPEVWRELLEQHGRPALPETGTPSPPTTAPRAGSRASCQQHLRRFRSTKAAGSERRRRQATIVSSTAAVNLGDTAERRRATFPARQVGRPGPAERTGVLDQRPRAEAKQ